MDDEKDPPGDESILTPELQKQLDHLVSPHSQTQPATIASSLYNSVRSRMFVFGQDETRRILRLISCTEAPEQISKALELRSYYTIFNSLFMLTFIVTVYVPKRYFSKFVMGLSCFYFKAAFLDHLRSYSVLTEYIKIKPYTASAQEIRNVFTFYYNKKIKSTHQEAELQSYRENVKDLEQQTANYFLLKQKQHLL